MFDFGFIACRFGVCLGYAFGFCGYVDGGWFSGRLLSLWCWLLLFTGCLCAAYCY